MVLPLSYIRVYPDDAGESHMETLAMHMHSKRYAPPAGPLAVSEPLDASAFSLLRLETGWQGDWHPSPFRQWLFFLGRKDDQPHVWA